MSNGKADTLIDYKQSIYQELKGFYNRKPGVPYSYQDFETAGIREFKVIYEKIKPLKIYEKIKLSNELISILLNDTNDDEKDVLNNLRGFIILNPIIDYYEVFLKNFKAVTETFNKYNESLIKIINKLFYEGDSDEEIKLALIISFVIKIDGLEEVLKVLSINNEYIFYVIKVYESMENSNEKIFKLAKNSKGYGKAMCIQAIQPISNNIIEWLILRGLEDNLGEIESLQYTMLSIDLLRYLKSGQINEINIELLSKAFSILFSEYTIDDIDNGINVCFEFLNLIDKYGKDIYSLYGVISIIYSMDTLILEEYDMENMNKISSLAPQYRKMVDIANEIYNKDIWKDIILSEIGNIEIDTEIIVNTAEKTSFKLKKREFEILINRDFTNPTLYRYAFDTGNKAIKKSTFKTAYEKLPLTKILNRKHSIKLEELEAKLVYHLCFYFLVKGIKYEEFPAEYKKINLDGLKATLIETRTQAINNLIIIKKSFEELDRKLIDEEINNEQEPSIKRKLISLLNNNYNKKKEYIDIEDIEVVPHVKDIYIMFTKVVGVKYVDLSVVYDILTEGGIVYLSRENDNSYDENAIQVVTETGYVIGYIPRSDNLILKNLMDKGKYFYGIIKNISNDYEEITLSIYLSYKDVINEITTTISLLSDNNNRYIQ